MLQLLFFQQLFDLFLLIVLLTAMAQPMWVGVQATPKAPLVFKILKGHLTGFQEKVLVLFRGKIVNGVLDLLNS